MSYFIFCLIEIEKNDKPCHISMTVCIHALFTEENQVNIPKHTHLNNYNNFGFKGFRK